MAAEKHLAEPNEVPTDPGDRAEKAEDLGMARTVGNSEAAGEAGTAGEAAEAGTGSAAEGTGETGPGEAEGTGEVGTAGEASKPRRSSRRRRRASRVSPTDYDRSGERAFSAVAAGIRQAEGNPGRGANDDRLAEGVVDESEIDADSASSGDDEPFARKAAKRGARGARPGGGAGRRSGSEGEGASGESGIPLSYWLENRPPHWG